MSEQKSTSVYQLENGNWGYRFVINIDGKKISRRRTKNEKGKPFTTEKAAKREREKAIKELQIENAVSEVKKENKTEKVIERKRIREVYEEYCQNGRKEKAYATIKKQEALWNNHILQAFGSTYLDNVRVADIQDFLAEL